VKLTLKILGGAAAPALVFAAAGVDILNGGRSARKAVTGRQQSCRGSLQSKLQPFQRNGTSPLRSAGARSEGARHRFSPLLTHRAGRKTATAGLLEK